MKPFYAAVLGAILLLSPLAANEAAAQAPSPPASQLTQKLNAYVGCINRLSARAFQSRARYFSWVGRHGPTGRERIVYGTYTIYDTADCRKKISQANFMEPRDAALEAAASAYGDAVGALEPLLKEADDYYTQENYKDDRMAKGRALHPRLVAAWDALRAPTRRCAAKSRPSTTSARWSGWPRSRRAKGARRTITCRR